jgi:Ca-activated chloride channel family protein
VTARRPTLALLALAAAAIGWLDPSAAPRDAARLYDEGKFDEAATRYNQALTDAPDSSLLHFNLGDAEYRRHQYEAAGRAFGQVPQDAAALDNQGNALYRLGQAAEEAKPQDALAKWAEALVAYRRAIGTDPTDEDAKFNYEWVSRKIAELQQKLEDQKNDQQQRQDEQQKDEQQKDQQQKEQEQKDQQEKDEQQQQEDQQPQGAQEDQQPQDQQQPEKPSQQGEQQPPDAPQPEQGEAAGGQAQPAEGELSREEATALLDGERNEELRPDEVIRRQLGTGEAPVQDW